MFHRGKLQSYDDTASALRYMNVQQEPKLITAVVLQKL